MEPRINYPKVAPGALEAMLAFQGGLDAWEESPYYSDRERAALAWTESVTNLEKGHGSDEVYEQVREFFTERTGRPDRRDHSNQC